MVQNKLINLYLSQTIDDFRNFYKPNKNKTEFYVLDTVDKVINLTNSQFSSNRIKIIKSGENIKINTYENELIQVIINLLNNARDELLKKDFEDEKLIFINVYKKNKKLFLEIKDNARGVSTQIIDKIFEAYFTTKNDIEGTGIGLYMSNEIITKSMKGKISVSNIEFEYESKKYIGANFQ